MLEKIFYSERIMMTIIVLNALLIFVGGFWPGNQQFQIIDACFTIIFLIEAIVKIRHDGWKGYWQKGWNRFDFIILLMALPSIADPFIPETMATNSLFVLRSLRLFKSFRMLRGVPHIEELLKGVKLAFNASFLVIVAFIILLFVFAILSTSIFGKAAPEFFGNPGISIYSIFRLFTVEGWYEIPDAISENGSTALGIFARVYFSLLLFFGGIIGMSLINSIFVDAMSSDNNDEVLKKLKKLDEKIDKLSEKKTDDGDGHPHKNVEKD